MTVAATNDPRRYIQLAARFREQISAGTLQPGQELPSITSLQRELGYARQTIAKALHLLADEGLIYQPIGLPYYVRGGGHPPTGRQAKTAPGDPRRIPASFRRPISSARSSQRRRGTVSGSRDWSSSRTIAAR
jgi:DNA-binding transcriptional regulator YhcF (GntR family)